MGNGQRWGKERGSVMPVLDIGTQQSEEEAMLSCVDQVPKTACRQEEAPGETFLSGNQCCNLF